jgi:hypothetical protein
MGMATATARAAQPTVSETNFFIFMANIPFQFDPEQNAPVATHGSPRRSFKKNFVQQPVSE